MEKRVKLKPKQLNQLNQIQQQKQQLNQMFQDLNQREASLLEIILEGNEVTEPIKSVKLEVDELVLELQEEPKPKKKKQLTETI